MVNCFARHVIFGLVLLESAPYLTGKYQHFSTNISSRQLQISTPTGLLQQLELNEGIFRGQTRNRVPHGQGMILFKANDRNGRLNYTGEFSNGKLSGFGVMFWRNGARYMGEIRNNVFQGQGNYTWPNGDVYFGMYSEGKRNGIGNMDYNDGDSYMGSWRNGQYNGQGKYRWSNGNTYVGDWKDGVAEGRGVFRYRSGIRRGERYEGEFRKGVKHGFGTYIYPNGRSFVGSYRNGLRHGSGTLYFSSDREDKVVGVWSNGVLEMRQNSVNNLNRGEDIDNNNQDDGNSNNLPSRLQPIGDQRPLITSTAQPFNTETPVRIKMPGTQTLVNERGSYIGELRNGVPHGSGEFAYNNNDPSGMRNYTGQWRFGRRNGQGTMFWKSGDSYTGDWLEDLPHGRGEYRWAVGHVYRGDYQFGAPEGRGTFMTNSGDLYEGEFENGLPNGEGEFTYGEGDKSMEKFVGNFRNGAFDGRGRYFFANGDRYEGDFRDGRRHGTGVMFFNNGGYREGTWRDDRPVGEIKYTKPDGTVEIEVYQQPRSDEEKVGIDLLGYTNEDTADSKTNSKELVNFLKPFQALLNVGRVRWGWEDEHIFGMNFVIRQQNRNAT